MKSQWLSAVGKLFIPEECIETDRRSKVTAQVFRKDAPKISLKAIFWVFMAIAAALAIGRLS